MSKPETRIETKVVGAEKSKENIVSYIVKVTAHIPPNLSVSWTVPRRYEQFREFASMMEKKIPKSKATLPRLTGKSLHASTQSLVSKRLRKLNAYLDEVSRISEVNHSHEWCCFLSSSFQDLFKIPVPPSSTTSSSQSTEISTTLSPPDLSAFEPSSLSSSLGSDSGSYLGGPSSFMPSYLNSASSASSGQSSPTSTSSTSTSTFSTPTPTDSPKIEISRTLTPDKTSKGKDKEQLIQTIADLERKLLIQQIDSRRASEQLSQTKRDNEELRQRIQQYSQRAYELESDIKQYVTEIRWVPDADRNVCPYCKEAFTLFFRRHHCRACGEICCSKCSDTSHETLSRVCVGCREGTSITSRTRSQLGMRPLVPPRSASFSASGRTLSSSSLQVPERTLSSSQPGSTRTLSSSSQSRSGQGSSSK